MKEVAIAKIGISYPFSFPNEVANAAKITDFCGKCFVLMILVRTNSFLFLFVAFCVFASNVLCVLGDAFFHRGRGRPGARVGFRNKDCCIQTTVGNSKAKCLELIRRELSPSPPPPAVIPFSMKEMIGFRSPA